MLTKNDLSQIRDIVVEVVQDNIRPIDLRLEAVERKLASLDSSLEEVKVTVNKMMGEIADLKLETSAIHEIISSERKEFEKRIEKLEQQAAAL
jgi:predicted  nucleic acid-binding Zn-ribbon protein